MLLEAAAASLTSSPAAASARKSRGSRKRGGKAKGLDDDEGEWLTVAHDGKPREKPKVELTVEEKLAKQVAQQQRQNMKVQSTMTEEYRLTRESLQSVPLFTPDE